MYIKVKKIVLKKNFSFLPFRTFDYYYPPTVVVNPKDLNNKSSGLNQAA